MYLLLQEFWSAPVREPRTPVMVLPIPDAAFRIPPTESAMPGTLEAILLTSSATPVTPFCTASTICEPESSHLPTSLEHVYLGHTQNLVVLSQVALRLSSQESESQHVPPVNWLHVSRLRFPRVASRPEASRLEFVRAAGAATSRLDLACTAASKLELARSAASKLELARSAALTAGAATEPPESPARCAVSAAPAAAPSWPRPSLAASR
mmetsp:Transcript_136817/g.381390  ORF Transcript_136817/g.381390 Transcript_136817/m.381390 type:complete len:210 (-) Transcript_136817:267-896(-)